MKPFWSNCVIQAVKRKLLHWRSVKLVPMFPKGVHHLFHMMWYEDGKMWHFTDKNTSPDHSDLWFKGTIESVEHEQFIKWCRKIGITPPR